MSIEDELKSAELESRRLDIEARRQELESRRRPFDLGHAAVLVTVIGGLSAVGFQALSAYQAHLDKQAAQEQSKRDFDFKSLELLLNKQSDILSCDAEQSARNLSLFKNVSEDTAAAFQNFANSKSASCVEQAAASAGKSGAEQARYDAVAKQGALITAAAGLGDVAASGAARYQVWLQYPGDSSERARAAQLQQALQHAGYRAPGIEHVSTAPGRYEVRYYKDTDEDRKAAAAIAAIVQSTLRLPSTPSLRSLAKSYPKLPDNVFEVWFPAGSDGA